MHYKSIKKYTKPQILVPISFTNINNHQEETEILLKVVLTTHTTTPIYLDSNKGLMLIRCLCISK